MSGFVLQSPALVGLQDDPALARRLGEAARIKALAPFDERVVVDASLAVHRELLGPTPA